MLRGFSVILSIMESIIATGATAAFGLIVWLIKENHRTRKEAAVNQSTIERSVLSLIRSQMVAVHTTAIAEWEITTAQMQAFREMHVMYTELGGNGAASHLLEDLQRVKLTTGEKQ